MDVHCGSVGYAAPEILKNENYLGELSDIWSCGVILYALVIGVLPFESSNQDVGKVLRQIHRQKLKLPDELSADLKDLIQKMLQV